LVVHNVWPLIGSLGRLVEVPFTASESVSAGERYSERVTLGGRRRVQVRPFAPRSWDVSMPYGFGPDVAALEGFASGAFGIGPWHWSQVAAQRGIVLPLRESMLLDYYPAGALTLGGPVHVNGVLAPRSLMHNKASGWTPVFRDVPVAPGR